MKKQKTWCEGVVLLVLGGMICFFGGTPVPTFATPIIIPQTDWSRVDLEVWVSDNPASPWREVLERPIGSGYIVELYKEFTDEINNGYLRSKATIEGPVGNMPNGEIFMEVLVDDVYQGGTHDAEGEILALWNFKVGGEAVNFSSSIIQEVPGRSTLSIYDRTSAVFLTQLVNNHYGPEDFSGTLEPLHEYVLAAYLEASMGDGLNFMTFTTNATFMPEPTVVCFLMLGGVTVWRIKKHRNRIV